MSLGNIFLILCFAWGCCALITGFLYNPVPIILGFVLIGAGKYLCHKGWFTFSALYQIGDGIYRLGWLVLAFGVVMQGYDPPALPLGAGPDSFL